MNDFVKTIIPFGKTIANRAMRRFIRPHILDTSLQDHKSIHPITKRYQEKINSALTGSDDVEEAINYIIETLRKLISKYDLTDEINQQLIFEQIIIFINDLYRRLRSKYVFNTLNKNNLKEFNELTVGNKLNNLMQKEGNYSYTGCCCEHYALLFKHIFDKLEENLKLGISSYLFIENVNSLNHAGVVVTFKGKNYLVDSTSFNGKAMQPIDSMGKHYDRMKDLSNFYKEDIPSNEIETLKNDYIENNYENYKVPLKSADELLSLLELIPIQAGTVSKMYNIFGNVLGANFRIFNDKILFLKTLFYHFDHTFTKDELDNISDKELIKLIVDSISYKTNINDNKRISVFNFERKYFYETLLCFLDKIDFYALRRILAGT